ncbi:hypothetical protein BJF92_03180 [Rhizobium rhizosphaerae]|uniref:Thermonuclease family protein n=1 Tax=Xaviernesmea rhizosphaerae TaxID=1672749 RepID=A0A1Q9AGX0_9HYPH|nr:hypothetical protein [Xaviernesmea rhizosphaerae]OLP54430.1 hypothetical protein BJF92_03180 [Xaviernesmea rhizosphaerae]
MIEETIKGLAVMVLQVTLAVLFVLFGIQAASALMTSRPPVIGSDLNKTGLGKTGLDTTTESGSLLWTTQPTRIDISRQTYERLPARLPPAPPVETDPVRFFANHEVIVIDNASFSWRGTTYRIDGIAPLPRKAVCKDVEGRRNACGLRAFKALDNALRGKSVACRPVGAETTLVSCRIGQRDLAALLRPLNS